MQTFLTSLKDTSDSPQRQGGKLMSYVLNK